MLLRSRRVEESRSNFSKGILYDAERDTFGGDNRLASFWTVSLGSEMSGFVVVLPPNAISVVVLGEGCGVEALLEVLLFLRTRGLHAD
jgi:hypothetical protein